MKPYLYSGQSYDPCGASLYPSCNPAVRHGPIDEEDGSLVPQLVPEEGKSFEVFSEIRANYTLDLDDGVIVLAPARLMHEQIRLGFAAVAPLKVGMADLVDFPIWAIRGIVRPPQSHLMVELVAIYPFPVYGSARPVNW